LRVEGFAHPERSAFTLVELLVAATITAMLSVVLSGLVLAVQRSWSYTRHLEEVSVQARAALDRMRYMIGRAGVYQLVERPPRLGLAVVSQNRWGDVAFPDVLVVWSGGRNGAMAPRGIVRRLPLVSELVIYTWDASEPTRLVEIVIPDDDTPIDFDDASFSTTVRTLLHSSSAQAAVLSDRLRKVSWSAGPLAGHSVGLVRFELIRTPSDWELTAIEPGEEAWLWLTWPQGLVTRQSGLRQETVRIEIQLTRRPGETASRPSDGIPFFGSASRRYVYQP